VQELVQDNSAVKNNLAVLLAKRKKQNPDRSYRRGLPCPSRVDELKVYLDGLLLAVVPAESG
jgi:hypothetical protein